jgi:hypothetical protein
MREIRIGRVLVASLHQAIADILPTRLAFYENWLDAEGLREGTIGLAPFYAVLSFLRQEGEPYQLITSRAGEYAAEWTVASMSPFARRLVHVAPRWLRGPLVLRLARRFVRDCYGGSYTTAKTRQGVSNVDVRESVFCSVREPVAHPLCGFYAAAFTRLESLFDQRSAAEVVTCRGTGQASCLVRIAPPVHESQPQVILESV